MAAPSLTWKDLGILNDALDEFERFRHRSR